MTDGSARQVDVASLALFRIVFGLVVFWETRRYLSFGWVERYYVGRPFHFTYWPFDFIAPWPGWGMKAHFVVLGIAGLMVAVGVLYRAAATAVFVGVAYFFLLDKATYLNHIYLLALLSFLMIFLPAHKAWSLDALRKPALRAHLVPVWSLWLLRFQIALPYFYGGLAKLNRDWLEGEPLRSWLARSTDFPFVGAHFTKEAVVMFMSWGALALDLGVVFLLCFRRTRPFAYTAAVLFHFMNSRVFSIGIFPWLMIAATALFFPADWPRRIYADLRRNPRTVRSIAWWLGLVAGGLVGWGLPVRFHLMQVLLGGLGGALALFSLAELLRPLQSHGPTGAGNAERPAGVSAVYQRGLRRSVRPVAVFLAVWVVIQLLVPLRHLVVPGHVYWTEEGQRFSWMMLVRSKQGSVTYRLTDATSGSSWSVDPGSYLTSNQVGTLADKPDMMLQFAHYLGELFRAEGYRMVEVRADTAVSLNGRPAQPIIDPEVDLMQVAWPWFGPAEWILPGPPPLQKVG